MPKNILIVGGGISGLALLHYLKRKYIQRGDVRILLLEKNDRLGGTIRSVRGGGCLFETGPNGFLDSKTRTLEFVKELGLENCLVRAGEEAGIRYLSVNNTLYPLPTNPKSFLSFKLLSPLEKLRILGEFFVPKGGGPDESVYDFGKRRLGEKFARIFLDPMVSGIYGGDAQKTNLKAVFPKIYALEKEHGSLFKAMIRLRKGAKTRADNREGGDVGMPKGTLTSFQGGLSQVIDAVGNQYRENVRLSEEITAVFRQGDCYTAVSSGGRQYAADELFICAPAYGAAPMLKDFDRQLSKELGEIRYAPMAVIGLVYPIGRFPRRPRGYGYLIPSSEKKEILGVLFESDIFPGRCGDNQVLFRVMIGGARHPDILSKTKDELIRPALEEVALLAGKTTAGETAIHTSEEPQEIFFVPWTKAIPQYDSAYCEVLPRVQQRLRQYPGLHLAANYLNGVSLNDCIESAWQAAENSSVA